MQTKWGTFILDLSKFISYYKEIIILNIYGVFKDDIFLKASNYFKMRNQQYVCVLTLLVVASKFPSLEQGQYWNIRWPKGKKKMEVLARGARGVVEVIDLSNESHLAVTVGHTPDTRPQGVKIMKVDYNEANFKEMVL